MKRIVVLTGSPRRNGNSSQLADSFIQAAEAAGSQVVRIDTAFLKVGGCRACDQCFKKPGQACAFDDDFNAIASALLGADIIVLVSPVYWYTFPAQLKAVIDKLYSFCLARKSFAGKQCALIACCEDTDKKTFDGVRFSFARSMELLQADVAGEVLVPGVLRPGDVAKTDGGAHAAALARKLCR